jgi:hypothetical protein
MRLLPGLGALIIVSVIAGCNSMEVDGLQTYGRLQDVSIADIREAIAATDSSDKFSALAVAGRDEIHACFRNPDLGWLFIRRCPADPSTGLKYKWMAWGMPAYDPEALRVIRAADVIYVFPLRNPAEPHRDDKHERALKPEARAKLVALLGDQRNWWQGGYGLVVEQPEPPDVGFVFRTGSSQLVLFWEDYLVAGTLNGQYIKGLFDKSEELQRWKRRYSSAELLAAQRSNHAMQPTARRRTVSLSVTNKLSFHTSRAAISGG